MANLHLTEISGEKFVLGLFWSSITPGKDNKKEARKIGDELGKDLFVIRSGDKLQAGYCSTSDGVKEGTYSLAAAISKGGEEIGIQGSWLGVFHLPDDSYALIAMNEGNFLPDCDVGGNFEEIKDKLLKTYSYGVNWEHMVIPPEFRSVLGQSASSKCVTKPLDEFLPKKNGKIKIHKWWKLEPVKASLPSGKIFAGFILAGIAISGAYFYQQHLAKIEAEEQARKLEIARQMLAQRNTPVSGQHLAHPWEIQITAQDFVKNCLQNINGSYVRAGDWQLETVTCSVTTIDYVWTRNKSNINKLMLVVPSATIDQSGDKATFSTPNTIDGTKYDELAIKPQVARANFLSYFQARGLSVKLTELPPEPVPPVEPGKENLPQPIRDWRTFEFQIQSSFSPLKFNELFAYPVTRINRIEMKLPTGPAIKDHRPKWLISGVIYTKL